MEMYGNVQHPEFPPGMLLHVPTWAAPILSVAMRMRPCIGFGTPIVAGQTLRKWWYCWRNLKWRHTRVPIKLVNHWGWWIHIVLYQHEIFLEPSVFPRVSYMFHGLDRRTSRCCTSWPCCTAIVSSGLSRAPAVGACSRPGDLGNRRTGFLGHFGAGKWKMTILP